MRGPWPFPHRGTTAADQLDVVTTLAARMVTARQARTMREALETIARDATTRAARRHAEGDHVGARADMAADVAARDALAQLAGKTAPRR